MFEAIDGVAGLLDVIGRSSPTVAPASIVMRLQGLSSGHRKPGRTSQLSEHLEQVADTSARAVGAAGQLVLLRPLPVHRQVRMPEAVAFIESTRAANAAWDSRNASVAGHWRRTGTPGIDAEPVGARLRAAPRLKWPPGIDPSEQAPERAVKPRARGEGPFTRAAAGTASRRRRPGVTSQVACAPTACLPIELLLVQCPASRSGPAEAIFSRPER